MIGTERGEAARVSARARLPIVMHRFRAASAGEVPAGVVHPVSEAVNEATTLGCEMPRVSHALSVARPFRRRAGFLLPISKAGWLAFLGKHVPQVVVDDLGAERLGDEVRAVRKVPRGGLGEAGRDDDADVGPMAGGMPR